jgi:alpha-mannosidase
MKTLATLALLTLCPILADTQTEVDRVTRGLDSLSSASFDGWKASPDLKSLRRIAGDPRQSAFDDSLWQTLNIGQSIYPDSCWLRKEIVLPQSVMGVQTAGRVRLLLSVDDYGYLWVNGEYRGEIPWAGEFVLTDSARPGSKFLIAIKAINTGGPLRLLQARIQPDASREFQEKIVGFSLSLRVGQKLLSFDTYQSSAWRRTDPGTDKSHMDRGEKERLASTLQKLASTVDIAAIGRGDLKAFNASVDAVRAQLKPIQDYVRRFTLYFDANAHIDAAWLWREKETIEVCKRTFSSVLHMMDVRPDFTYTQSSAAYYDWMQRLYPDIFSGMQQRIREGRWEVIGGMWVEPDCNIPSGESWARHLLYAKRYFRQMTGKDVTIGWNPDSFGYNWNMPLFYRNAGIDAFITQKIGWNDTNVFPHRLFWWESGDGSRILSYFPFDYVSTLEDPARLVDWLRQYEANTGLTKLMILFGVGDHGGGPSLDMLARVDRMRSLDIFPTIEYGTATKYLEWVRSQDLSQLPVWNDELYLEYHQGTFTTQANMKSLNRTGEVLLTNAEKFSCFASLYGRAYPASTLTDAWKTLLFNQFHDILPGSSIREVYIDATDEHQEMRRLGSYELRQSLDHIAARVSTAGPVKGSPVMVFNPLAWERTDIARILLPEGDAEMYAVFDSKGKEVPSQPVSRDRLQRELLFVAHSIPPLGYEVYTLRKQQPAAFAPLGATETLGIENQMFRVTVDDSTGWVKQIVDKRSGRRLLEGPGNRLVLLEDTPREYDAWNLGWTGIEYPTKFRGARVVENGPVRTVLRVEHDCLKPGKKKDFPTEDFPTSFFTQDIILYSGLDRIDFVTNVDWWEEHTMLKVAFPLAVSDSIATYEIPYGTIARSTQLRNSWEKAKVEVPASRWADVSAADYGVSLLNTAKYGYDIKGNVMRLSLLRSPKSPDPTADRGKHSIAYALYPHRGGWESASTVRRGYEYNTPFLVQRTDIHKGPLPLEHSFLQLDGDGLVLSSIKKAEDSDSWVVQLYNSAARESTGVLRLPRTPKRVVRCNFLEEEGEAVAFRGPVVTFPTPGRSVLTLKVYF